MTEESRQHHVQREVSSAPEDRLQEKSPLAGNSRQSEPPPVSPRRVRRFYLSAALIGAMVGAGIMLFEFGVYAGNYKHFYERAPQIGVEFTGIPPEVFRSWAEEDYWRSIEEAKKRPHDRLWRAWAGPLSNMDRLCFEGKQVLGLIGAVLGAIGGLGGALIYKQVIGWPEAARENAAL